MSEFRMPSLGADMTHGRLLEWRVRPGDTVRRGDIVALVDTDKAAIEVEVFEDGVVAEVLVEEGERVPVGTVLARVSVGAAAAAPEGEAREETTGAAAAASVTGQPQVPVGREGPNAAAGGATERRPISPARQPPRLRASPAARVFASEKGIQLAQVAGTGPDGAITRADIEKAAAAAELRASEVHPRRVSALAREVAAELGVQLEDVQGTGPLGSVTRADVERAAEATRVAPPTAAEATRVAPPTAAEVVLTAPAPAGSDVVDADDAERRRAMRRAIAAAVSRSKREIPHYYLSTRIDVSHALAWMEGENLRRPLAARLLPAALLLRSVALALGQHPELNGFWVDDAFRPGDGVHVGVAISLRGGGLIAPAIRSADTVRLDETMSALTDLVRRARSGGLRASELTSPTITVTNLGERGADSVFGVIYPPQVALVGFGRIAEQPWAENGMLGVRSVITATLSGDHRATDGHLGGLFLADLERRLQRPEEL